MRPHSRLQRILFIYARIWALEQSSTDHGAGGVVSEVASDLEGVVEAMFHALRLPRQLPPPHQHKPAVPDVGHLQGLRHQQQREKPEHTGGSTRNGVSGGASRGPTGVTRSTNPPPPIVATSGVGRRQQQGQCLRPRSPGKSRG